MPLDDAHNVLECGSHIAVELEARGDQILEQLRVHLGLTEALQGHRLLTLEIHDV